MIMSCCGKARVTTHATPNITRRTVTPGAANRHVQFEYIGETSMTVVGPVTGLRYHFAAPGAQSRVDARDRSSLLGIPKLRQV
jgi:hypothetical protein